MEKPVVRRLPLRVGEKPASILVNLFNAQSEQFECVSPFFTCVGEGSNELEAIKKMTELIATEQLVKATSRVRGRVKEESSTTNVRIGLKAKEYLNVLAQHYNITQSQLLDWLVFIQMSKMGEEIQAEFEGR